MQERLLYLASCLKSMNLFYHLAHNLAARVPFFADHEAFGEFYEALDNDYDSVIERCIGLFGSQNVNIKQIVNQANSEFQSLPGNEVVENKKFFEIGLALEQKLQSKVQELCKLPEASEGTKQLIGEIANQSEIRTYKLKQRIK